MQFKPPAAGLDGEDEHTYYPVEAVLKEIYIGHRQEGGQEKVEQGQF